MYVYLIAWFQLVGMQGYHYDEELFFIKHKTHDECMVTAKEVVPKITKLVSKRGIIESIGFKCVPVTMLSGEFKSIPKKQCESHKSGENCLRGL